ncbi:HNH endonuclease signature motif containing protein [Leifsonia shinshuensis]|uniref:HNH endonuclease signature motif containing protein n=1 Tax=Leifsonia shinshuensis TaxID=150026 RepID=UPI0035A99172
MRSIPPVPEVGGAGSDFTPPGIGGPPSSPECSPGEGDDNAPNSKSLRREFEDSVRPKYWIDEAARNPGSYSAQNLARMQLGRPPFGVDGFPMELHHIVPLSQGGSNDLSNLAPMTRTDHRLGENYRLNHPRQDGC